MDSSQKMQYKWLTHDMRNVNENFTEIPFISCVIGKDQIFQKMLCYEKKWYHVLQKEM